MTEKVLLSYAQHAEDVTLFQAFKAKTSGFYVDVGAAGPVQHSVTKLFYDRGWRGINIEPIHQHINALNKQRPRDINIQAVIDVSEGTEILFVFPTLPGITTTARDIAQRYIENGLYGDKQQAAKITLEQVLKQHCTQTIDFLKIDVEGTEAQVLQSFDLYKWHPRVLIIEATDPRTALPSHEKWEHIVLAAGYELAKFDGLNRFYTTKDEPELRVKLNQKTVNYDTIAISKEKSRKLRVV